MERGVETADWKAGSEEGYSGNWRRTHGKVGPVEVRHRTVEMNPGGEESDKPGEGQVMREVGRIRSA